MPGRPGRVAASTILLPVRTTVSNLFVVFFSTGAETPKFHEAKARIPGLLAGLLAEPLLTRALAYGESRLQFDLAKRDELPPIPIGLLRSMGLDELEERKLDNSTLAFVIQADDDNRPPHVGLWTAIATATAAGDLVNGTIFDPGASRIVRAGSLPRLPSDGRIAVASHIGVPFSIDERGLGWMTTVGMVKFGLPELEVRDVPPNLKGLGHLVNTTAQRLLEMLDGSAGAGLQEALELPRDLRISAQARGSAARDTDGDSRETVVGLEFHGAAVPTQPAFLRLVRPSGTSASHSRWLFEALEQLMGSEREILDVRSSDDAMQKAHRRAMGELRRVRTRFARGLRPGETLYVKHGFDAGNNRKEYMWIVVNTWVADRLHGQLVNNARDSDLRAGHDVEIDESAVFDWRLELPHGEHEGDYTSDVARQQQRP